MTVVAMKSRCKILSAPLDGQGVCLMTKMTFKTSNLQSKKKSYSTLKRTLLANKWREDREQREGMLSRWKRDLGMAIPRTMNRLSQCRQCRRTIISHDCIAELHYAAIE